MKKAIALIAAALMCSAMLTACMGDDDKNSSNVSSGGAVNDVISGAEDIVSDITSGTEDIVSDIVSGTEDIVSDTENLFVKLPKNEWIGTFSIK